ncbi:hypothetical protein G6F46_005808 [Rhizopus delemar]|nr:hypothetical protein G6F43_009617 [Rhizopus delemar]KAG1544785.1 hypothetical protein G6F51_005852 [Rhizopus arrhizus]KAG1460809.1 hypothetical protein G6F55_003943 [Rhizopus delemar]KAG1498307.1 hypothetical protein G6F54_005168 [Rhizopus delemar]KAG1512173.1 hypothetical protein G6F53_005386 [Rhizopus delemar]
MMPTINITKDTLRVPSGPPSPTLSTTSFMSSVSWMAEKTSTELIPMLKNAYTALKDKEKDLVLAAEIGKSLLEHNLRLKSNYDSLLQSTTPPITPSSSTSNKYIQEQPIIDISEEEHTMHFIPSRITREAMIEVLERKNADLTKKLELAMAEQDKLMKSNSKNTRKLENEISLLKSNLDIATTKMQELEEMNERQRKQEELMASKQTQNKMDEELVEELYNEIDKMEQEKQNMIQSKLELETKLAATLKDLGELKVQFEKFEFTQSDFEELKEAYERQFAHIEELKTSLEEHRIIIQRLKERGINVNTAYSTSASSEHGDISKKHTLLGELESEWLKTNNKSPAVAPSSPQTFMEFTEKSLSAIYNAPSLIGLESVLSKATGMDPQLIDDAINLINQIEAEHFQEKTLALYEKHGNYDEISDDEGDFGIFQDRYPESGLYPSLSRPEQMQIQRFVDEPKTFVGKLQNHVRKLFTLVWKWCRFSVILATALIINAYQGPDSLLIAY